MRNDHQVASAYQWSDKIPVKEAPRRISMQEQYRPRVRISLVKICHRATVDLEGLLFPREQPLEPGWFLVHGRDCHSVSSFRDMRRELPEPRPPEILWALEVLPLRSSEEQVQLRSQTRSERIGRIQLHAFRRMRAPLPRALRRAKLREI